MKQTMQNILALADIQIDGDRPWDIQIHNPKLYKRILTEGSLALGESYVDSWWDSKALDQLVSKILIAELDKKKEVKDLLWKNATWDIFKAKIINPQSRSRAYEIGKKHYDIGNDLYKKYAG